MTPPGRRQPLAGVEFLTVRATVFAPAAAVTLILVLLSAPVEPLSLPAFFAPAGTPPMRFLVLWAAAMATVLATAGKELVATETFEAVPRIWPWQSAWDLATLTATLALTTALAATPFFDGAAALVRNVIGLYGIALLLCDLHPALGVVAPWLVAVSTQYLGLASTAGEPYPWQLWAWPVQPAEDMLSWLCAGVLLSSGIAVRAWRRR